MDDGSLRGEDGNEDNVAALQVHQHGEDVNPFPTSSISRSETTMGERRTCEAL
jgi:hypothetical protein